MGKGVGITRVKMAPEIAPMRVEGPNFIVEAANNTKIAERMKKVSTPWVTPPTVTLEM